MQLDYFILDVFTDVQLTGNQLAVVVKADDVSDDLMQKIAREFGLSETIFLTQPLVARHAAAARIFTPTNELPFAGHPTVGASVLLGLQQRASAVRIEEKIGLITCVMDRIDRRTGQAHFKLPQLPEETGPAPANEDIAGTLGISPDDVGCDAYQPACFSAGLEYTLVPVRDAQVLSQIKLERRGWSETYGQHQSSVYVFTQTDSEPGNDFGARMFQPGLLFGEDSATGSAVASLIGLIAKSGPVQNGQNSYKVRQGSEIGRPSLIEMQIGMSDGVLVHGGIGGKAIICAQGQLDLT